MNEKKISLLFIAFFAWNNLFGQLMNIPTIGNEVLRETRYSDVEGSPYLFSEWKTGVIFDNAGREYPNRLIKYDEYKDQLELNQDGSVLLLNSGLYPKFSISFLKEGSDKFFTKVFKTGYKVEGYKPSQYFEVLYEGSSIFLKKAKINYIDETVNSYGTSTRIKRFTTDTRYFIIDSSGTSTEIKLKKSSLLEALKQDRVKAEKYIDGNKVKVKSEQDVIEILSSL